MKRYIYTSQDSNEFSTFELKDVDTLFASTRLVTGSRRFISDIETKRKFGDELFQFIDEAYDELGGFKSFKDMDRFVNDSYLWYITYDGPQPSANELDLNRIYVVSVYRKKFGLKMVGIARRKIARSDSFREENQNIRLRANAALTSHLRFMAQRGWAEVSDRLEDWCNRVLGPKFEINPEFLVSHNVFDSIQPDLYDNHYKRPLRKGGPMLTKIAYGTMRI